MFFTMTPEITKKIAELQKKKLQPTPTKPPMTFNQYYNKMFLEEAKYFVENPKFSMKYMMAMAHLQKTIKERAIKEYNEKYPGAPIDEPKKMSTHDVEQGIIDQFEQCETESVMSEYDVIDSSIIDEDNFVEDKPLRRSKRLQTKFI
jgi:hypothetical protein